MSDVVRIAGAGLAGLTSAVILAESGRTVEVHERKARVLPSSGAHTEGIRNYRPFDVLEELRSVGFQLNPFTTVHRTVRCSPRHRNVLHGPAYYGFIRGMQDDTVDQTLYRRAIAAGVTFRFRQDLAPEEADIVATGPPKKGFNILGAGYTFSTEGSPMSSDVVYALFNNDIAPAGYLTITPGKYSHSIYSVSWKEFEYERLLARMRKSLEISWVRELLGTSHWTGRIHGRAWYLRDPIAAAERNDSLYVGEAGGFQDAVAGFGFRYAAMTGALAARAILKGLDYRALPREAFGSEFEESFAFRETINDATNDDYDRMIASLGNEISLQAYVGQREPRGF